MLGGETETGTVQYRVVRSPITSDTVTVRYSGSGSGTGGGAIFYAPPLPLVRRCAASRQSPSNSRGPGHGAPEPGSSAPRPRARAAVEPGSGGSSEESANSNTPRVTWVAYDNLSYRTCRRVMPKKVPRSVHIYKFNEIKHLVVWFWSLPSYRYSCMSM